MTETQKQQAALISVTDTEHNTNNVRYVTRIPFSVAHRYTVKENDTWLQNEVVWQLNFGNQQLGRNLVPSIDHFLLLRACQ